jgi:serpin B
MRNACGRKVEVVSKLFLIFLMVPWPMLSMFGESLRAPANSSAMAASAVNSIGVDLLHQTARANENALLSPYSIETALAMTYAGSDGKTREEMARVLRLSGDDAGVAKAFAELQTQLDEIVRNSQQQADQMKKYGRTNDVLQLNVANRLFGEQHYTFRPAFLDRLKTDFGAPFQPMDFRHHSTAATKTINDWVTEKTKDRIQNLVPAGALNGVTRLVLVNALYMKAPWAEPFQEQATRPLPFHVRGGEAADVPTMNIQKTFGYARANGVTIVSLPYQNRELQFLIILPDDTNGLGAVEAGLTADQLAGWASLPNQNVKLFLPKFKMQPPTLPLGNALQKLGMTTAFDKPPGSANFDRMAPRLPNDYLAISDVFHKTFISVDEKGTEAAAATAAVMMQRKAEMRPLEPVEVKVGHPFIFAIQHRTSGACLFLGHVVDPR